MCRMSVLIATQGTLSKAEVSSQYQHLQRMATGSNSYPFRFGDFTTDTTYPLDQKLYHGDGFGYYFSGSKTHLAKSPHAVYHTGSKNIIETFPETGTVSLFHARFATQGNKNIINNAPFDLECIVGAHNGTVSGLARGDKSDSHHIMEVFNKYLSQHSPIDVPLLEKTIIEQIVEPSSGYGAMNLIIKLKKQGKILVLCSYGSTGAKTPAAKGYYHMVITSNGRRVYISSETDHGKVVSYGKKMITRNHTLYVIDEKTGKITEHRLSDLEKAVNKKNTKKKSNAKPEERRTPLKRKAA